LRRGFTLAAGALAAAITGCGGSSGPSTSQFKQQFAAQKTQFRQLGLDAQQALLTANGKSDTALGRQFSALSGRATTTASDLRRLKSPSQYQGEVSQLAAAFDTVATDTKAISGAAAAHDATAARAATARFVQDAGRVKTVDDRISRQLGLPTGQ
jgi:hypothetical protein